MNKLKGCSNAVFWIFDGKPVKARLHSVFRHVLNIMIEGQMISLISADIPWNSLSIQTENAIDFDKLGIDAGNQSKWQIAVQPEKICIGKYEFLKTSGFTVFDACVKPMETERLSVIKEAAAQVISENRDRGFAKAIYSNGRNEDMTTEDLKSGYLSIREALKTGDQGQLKRACFSLLGAGMGLTPSGDDFLCGMLQMLWALKNIEDSLEVRNIITKAVKEKLYETCDISKAYLLQSLQGYAGELMQKLFLSVNQQESRKYMDCISQIGHSSGVDLLCGVWTILDALV